MKALAAAVVVKDFIEANIQVEKFERSMTLLKGSTTLASQELDYIKTLSRTLGLEVWSTADAYIGLAAATKGTSLEGAATKQIFEAVALAMSSLGKSAADTQGALLAISQMVSKGTVQMEELRGQLGERLPGAFQAAAKAMGLTTKELDDLVSSGKLTAEEFLPKLATALNQTFGNVTHIDTFQASWNRLKLSMDEAFIEIGKTGLFDGLTKGVQLADAAVVGAVTSFKLLGEIIGAIAGGIATGNFSGIGDAVDAAMTKAAKSTQGVHDQLLGVKDAALYIPPTIIPVTDSIDGGMQKASLSTKELEKATGDANKALRELGIDPKTLTAPLSEILNAFDALAKNPAVRGDQLLTGLLVTLDKIANGPAGAKDLQRVFADVEAAYKRGALNADEYAAATQALTTKQQGLWEGMPRATGTIKTQEQAMKDSAKAAQEAKEKADAYKLKMEEIASNERIKTIEARVQLNIAQLQADTEVVKAIFSSIDNSINSTGSLLSDLFGKLTQPNINSIDYFKIRDQIDKENKQRAEAFELQKKLTEATIEEIKARTQSMINGDALIKIDGAGLQPHLEAFMWEILKTIQTRVNRDGLKMLLGV